MAWGRAAARVQKPRPARVTRQKSRLTQAMPDTMGNAAEESSDVQMANTDLLKRFQNEAVMEEESQETIVASAQPRGKGKGRLVEKEPEEERPFPLMDLPTEIRLEIYRACLTRPYKLKLSKVEKSQSKVETSPKKESQSEAVAEELVEPSGPHYRMADSAGNVLGYVPTNSRGTNFAQLRSRALDLRHSHRARVAAPSTGSNASSSTSTTLPPPPRNVSAGQSTPLRRATSSKKRKDTPTKGRDSLVINILGASKEVYKEARGILYGENVFDLDINNAVTSLAILHQRSRRQIKHVELEIPTYTEILERFSEIVRLSLRYCTGLKKFVIHTPFTLPGADGTVASSNTTVYANGFDILRWLPQECEVVMSGSWNPEIEAVVNKHLNLARSQTKLAYARRQLISNDTERSVEA